MRATALEYRFRLWIIAALFVVAFAVRRAPRFADGVRGVLDLSDDGALRATLLLAASLAGVAAWLRIWGTAYLTSQVVQDGALRTESLVADGPYRHVRNPLYLGTIVFGAAIGMLGTIPGWCVLVLGLVVFVYRLIGHEERALVAAQDCDYVAYCAAVPRLWPSPRPRLPPSPRRPMWRQAVVGELLMAIAPAACVAGAATTSLAVTLDLLGAGFVLWVIVRRVIRARARANVHATVSLPDDP